ncbi:MAG: peptidyl-prolyl cis-trans isomerase [Pseudomonadota bacterium]|nr:peptidyl-prolyl cis-trans isomerase [Pseudomonadota bacterium]
MIQFFIKIVNSWVGRLIFGFLLFGMLFGLGYMGFSQRDNFTGQVIIVGERAISIQELERVFRSETQKLSGLMGGQYISPRQAIEMGLLDNIVLQQKNEMVFDGVKDALGLTATNAAVQKYVENNPAFADVTGQFDRNLFMAYLRQNQVSEAELATKLKNELATRHLTHAIEGLSYAPDSVVEQAYRHQHEKRQVFALFIETDRIQLDKAPSNQDLKDYYEAFAADQFMTPEYRVFSYIRLMPDDLLKRIEVSETDIDLAYAERKSQFETPEKRLVSQMFFKDEETINDIKDRITPDNFETLATDELGQTPDVTNFGYVSYNEISEELSDAVFKANRGEIIGPIATANGYHLLLVKDIKAGQKTPTEVARKQIRDQLAHERIYDETENLTRQLEEILGEGKSLSDAATELKLTLHKNVVTDITGLNQEGKGLTGDLANPDLIQNLFALRVGESTPIFDTDKGIIVAELSEIIPVQSKPFETVRSELKNLWVRDQQKEKLQSVADALFRRIQEGSSLLAQGKLNNFSVIEESELMRGQTSKLPIAVVQSVFKQAQGLTGLTQIPTEKGIYITQVNYVYRPSSQKDPTGVQEIAENIKAMTGAELLSGVIGSYAEKMHVFVNEPEIKKAFSTYIND